MGSAGLSGKTLGSLAWMGSGTGVQAVLRAVVLLVLARLLTPEAFGAVAAALVVINFSNIFAQLGFGQAIVQRPTLTTEYVRTAFTLSLALGVAFTVGVWLLSPLLAGLFSEDGLVTVLRVLSISFVLTGPAVAAQGLMQRELEFKRLAIIETVSFFIGFAIVGVVTAALGWGVWALVAAHLSSLVLKGVMLLVAHRHPMRPLLDRASAAELARMGGGFTLGRFFNFLALQGDYFVVGRWMGLAALGAYSRAYELMVAPASLFGKVVDVVLFPVLSKVQDDPGRLASGFLRGLAFVALLTMPLCLVATILAPELVWTLLGTQWLGVVPAFQVLALGIFFRTSYKISEAVLRAKGAVFARAWRQAVYATCVVLGAWVGHHWGLGGVAVGVLVAITINFALMTSSAAQLAGASSRSILAVHVPIIALTAAVGGVTALAAVPLRLAEASPPTILLVGGAAAAACVLALTRLAAPTVLGPHGLWVAQRLAGMVRLSRVLPERWRTPVAERG